MADLSERSPDGEAEQKKIPPNRLNQTPNTSEPSPPNAPIMAKTKIGGMRRIQSYRWTVEKEPPNEKSSLFDCQQAYRVTYTTKCGRKRDSFHIYEYKAGSMMSKLDQLNDELEQQNKLAATKEASGSEEGKHATKKPRLSRASSSPFICPAQGNNRMLLRSGTSPAALSTLEKDSPSQKSQHP